MGTKCERCGAVLEGEICRRDSDLKVVSRLRCRQCGYSTQFIPVRKSEQRKADEAGWPVHGMKTKCESRGGRMQRTVIEIRKNAKGKPDLPCPYYPDKMVGDVRCRGCIFHIKHDRKFTKVTCSRSEENKEWGDTQ